MSEPTPFERAWLAYKERFAQDPHLIEEIDLAFHAGASEVLKELQGSRIAWTVKSEIIAYLAQHIQAFAERYDVPVPPIPPITR